MPVSIAARKGSQSLRRPDFPMGEMAGFEPSAASAPAGGMAGFESSPGKFPMGEMAGLGGLLCAPRMCRDTVSRLIPSSRAIRRCGMPRSYNVNIESLTAILI